MHMSSKLQFAGLAALVLASVGAAPAFAQSEAPSTAVPPALPAFLAYPFETELVASPRGGVIAWVESVRGVRNVWAAQGPGFAPHALTHLTADDGQELTNIFISPDGRRVVWVRGGDHDENWPAEGNLAPDPAASPEQPKLEIWSAPADGSKAPLEVAEGDTPSISAQGVLAFIKDNQVWTAPLDGSGKAERLFFDRGKDGDLSWSPDGQALAFVSNRGDHAFVAVFRSKNEPLIYLAASTSIDDEPAWSPDSRRIAFVRRQGHGGAPEPILTEVPHPWSIWSADARTGAGGLVWRSGDAIADSVPQVAGEANLQWMAGDRLVFLSEADGWQHLYSVPATGGPAQRLTPGAFMVEHVAEARGRSLVLYDANTGQAPDDIERRHVFAVPAEGGQPQQLTDGTGLEYEPVWAGEKDVAFVAAGPKAPTAVAVVSHGQAGHRQSLATGAGGAFTGDDFVTPRAVTFKSSDGLTIHADLFETPGGGRKPAVVFVHGGPPRQMLLGWSYMDYYSNAYAMNEYLATHGFVVLSVNYRLGIGYGRAFNHPAHAGFRGASEYEDVLAGGRWLQAQPDVDPARIGIWGGSYGGFLTAMALARNSDVFKAGVDLHGVHDWTSEHSGFFGRFGTERYEKGDADQAKVVAWQSSPVSDLRKWTSPVLLIQGDDDRNVDFHQTVDLARRLEALHVPYEELVIPNEIHGFLRYASWLEADSATVDFLDKVLKPQR
jgi:dipeptidyl aminopeptidase/acylaminoacyl peptidase